MPQPKSQTQSQAHAQQNSHQQPAQESGLTTLPTWLVPTLLILILLLIALTLSIGYFAYKNIELKQQNTEFSQQNGGRQQGAGSAQDELGGSSTQDAQGGEQDNNSTAEEQQANTAQEEQEEQGQNADDQGQTGLMPLDETWNLYRNPQLGFSIQVPQQANHYRADCTWTEAEGDHSYRLQDALAEVTVFPYAQGVYLAFDHFYQLQDETIEDGRHYYGDCERQDTSLEWLQSERRTWHIISKPVANDEELTTFIQDRFGEACDLGEKTPSRQDGVLDVSVAGGGPESGCFMNFRYVLKYAPSIERAFTWDMGQAVQWWADSPPSAAADSYDEEMRESFEVLGV